MRRRDPWYRRAADWVIECDGIEKEEITEKLLREFYRRTGVEEVGEEG